MMLKVLITGGSGFIGTNLIECMITGEYDLMNLDNTEPLVASHLPFFKHANILNHDDLESVIQQFNPEIIIHLAAVTDLNGATLSYYNANIEGTQNIINISKKLRNLRKVIFTSSMYVCEPGFVPPDFDTYKPHTVYGESKVKGEGLVKEMGNVPFEWVIIRPTSIWGPWFNIPYIDFFKIVYHGKYFDFGRACTKTYGFIGNTVDQIKKLIHSDQVNGKTFYVGDNPPIQISEWADEISIEMGKGKTRKIPFPILKAVAKFGDLLSVFNINFPLTSFRLKNMTTNNILPLDNLYNITGPPAVSRLDGVKLTVQWLEREKGFIMNR